MCETKRNKFVKVYSKRQKPAVEVALSIHLYRGLTKLQEFIFTVE